MARIPDYLRAVLITSGQLKRKGGREKRAHRYLDGVNPRGSRSQGVPRAKPRGELADIQWQGSAKNLSQLPFKRRVPLVAWPDTGSALVARCCATIAAITVINDRVNCSIIERFSIDRGILYISRATTNLEI